MTHLLLEHPALIAVMNSIRDIPAQSKGDIDRAGKVLADPLADRADDDRAARIYTDWRTQHEAAVAAFFSTLARAATDISPGCIISSRLKRLETVRHKLRRLRHFQLSELQDIGGLRAVVDTPEQAAQVADRLTTSAGPRFRLKKTDDYIYTKPKASGYRSIHKVFSYEADVPGQSHLRGLKFEVQIRSRLQHVWATANEAVGTFIKQDLKFGEGDPDWQRLFALAGTEIARREHTPDGPGMPSSPQEFASELAALRDKLQVEFRLTVSRAGIYLPELMTKKGAAYFLLQLNPTAKTFRLESYLPEEFDEARRMYASIEQETRGAVDVVLVSVDSIDVLRKAYPNYFYDVHEFIEIVYGPDYEKKHLDPERLRYTMGRRKFLPRPNENS